MATANRSTPEVGATSTTEVNPASIAAVAPASTATVAPAIERPPATVPALCLLVFLAVWVALAVHPKYRADWLLENLPTLIAVPILVLTYPRFRFSDRAYVQGTAFLVLHTIGSHYTYSEVPIGDWAGRALGLTRNHYDRVVHLTSGLLLLRPVRELAIRDGQRLGSIATLAFPVSLIAASSVVYEMVEWLVAVTVDPAAGTAFLGTQGDVWDAQKDMSLALVGGVVAGLLDLWLDPPPSRPPGGLDPDARHP